MKILIIAGTGLIGTMVARNLTQLDVIPGSPTNGIDALTGTGLDEAMAGTDIIIDLANSKSFDDAPALDFFQTAGRNLIAAKSKASVKHHVALSIVGVDRMQNMGYMRAKKCKKT